MRYILCKDGCGKPEEKLCCARLFVGRGGKSHALCLVINSGIKQERIGGKEGMNGNNVSWQELEISCACHMDFVMSLRIIPCKIFIQY